MPSRIAICVATLSCLGCWREPAIKDTYPGNMAIYSAFGQQIWITRCEGLGFAQPGGNILPTELNYPQAGYGYGRQKSIPSEFTIFWKHVATGESFSQLLKMPDNLKGSTGTLLFYLNEENVWSLWIVNDKYDLHDVPIHRWREPKGQ